MLTENCGLGVALTDKEEIRNEILEKYHNVMTAKIMYLQAYKK